jgi:hypothetical protein
LRLRLHPGLQLGVVGGVVVARRPLLKGVRGWGALATKREEGGEQDNR